jgi:hypothetical protein
MTPHKTHRPWKPCTPNGPISIVTSVTPEIYKRCDPDQAIWMIRRMEYQIAEIMKEATEANNGGLK